MVVIILAALQLLPLSLFFISIFFLLYRITNSKPNNSKPPGPPPLPIIGNLHQLGSLPHRTLRDLSEIYGPILHLKLGFIPTVIISSPSLAEELFKAHDQACCSRPSLVAFREYSYGFADVLCAPYGESWRNMRKIFTTHLLSSKLLPTFRWIREEEAAKMVQSIKDNYTDMGSAVDISHHALSFTKSTIFRVAFGKKADGAEFDQRSTLRLLRAIEEAPSILGAFFVADYFPGFAWIDKISGNMRRLRRSAGLLDAFYQQVIDEHLDGEKKGGREEDIIDSLISLWRQGQLTMDSIKAAIMNILLGGTETSASTITWAMAELARHPNMMDKAQNEVRKVIGNKGKVEESDLPRLEYLKLVVNETMRLHPIAPLLAPREMMQSCHINGFNIEPNTRVLVNVWAIGRDQEAWENPEEFNPDRFIDNIVDYKGQHFQFLPFGAGRRICPGILSGSTMVELAIANLVYAFNWKLPLGMKEAEIDMSEAPGLATPKKIPLYLLATTVP